MVRQALLDFSKQSIRKINEHTGVDRRRVARIRQELIEAGIIADSGGEVVVERKGQIYRQKVHRKEPLTVPAGQAEGRSIQDTTSQEETAPNRSIVSSKSSPTALEPLRDQVQDLAGQLISQISESHLSELEKRLRALAEEFGVELGMTRSRSPLPP